MVIVGLFFGLGAIFSGLTIQHLLYIGIFAGAIMFYLLFSKGEQIEDAEHAIRIDKSLFQTSALFNALAIGIMGILAALYIIFW